jgi:CheY-like chemotaxis protein
LSTILVVEDEALISMFVSDELESAGYTVLTAGNADQAIALLAIHDISCIFTDIDMPGSMDGLKPGSVFLPKPYRAAAVIDAIRQF